MSKDDEETMSAADEAVVDALLRTDRILERYRERSGDGEFDKPGLTERLLMAQIVNQTVMAQAMGGQSGLTQEAVFGKLDELRTRLFEELKAYAEGLLESRHPAASVPPCPHVVDEMPPVEPPTPEELGALNQELEAQGAPDYATLRALAPHDADLELLRFRVRRDMGAAMREVTIVPANVHANFEDVLFQKQVDMAAAKKTLELLLSTPQGHDMLKLMVYDAVDIQRKAAAQKKTQDG